MAKDDAILKEAEEAFELCQEREIRNRKEALEDLRFARLDEHWPLEVRKQRELEGRPCLTIPKLPPVIRQVVNDARQNKPAITVHPVDSNADPETAEIFSGIIRNIEQSSDAEVAYDTALEFAVTGGFGYFRINTRYAHDDSFEQDIVIERVADPFSVYGDPYSTAADSSDWNTAFVVDAVPKDAFERRWKGADAVDWSLGDYSRLKSPWMDGERVLVAEYWSREEVAKQIVALSDGQIVELAVYEAQKELFDAIGVSVIGRSREVKSFKTTQRIMTGCEVLETTPWAGKYIPIVPVYGEEVFVEGERYLRGVVRSAKDAQRMFNYWRTTSTELVALAPKAPFIGAVGQFETDAAKWATANTQSHAYIEYDNKGGAPPPQRQPFAGVPAGALQEAMNASDDIKAITGIYDASLGAKSNETSGRAILARQREGDVSTFHYIDNLSRAIRHAGRILIDLIPKVYSTPRVVRALGPDEKVEIKQVNQPTTEKRKNPETGQMEEISRIYDLSAGKYDLVVKAGPSFSTRREEAANQMIELMRANPAIAPLIGDLLAENLDWPGADTIAERLKAMLPQQLQEGAENPQVAQAKQVIAQMGEAMKKLQAEAEAAKNDNTAAALKVQQDAEKARLDHEAKMRSLEIDAFNAESNRIKALNTKQTPLDPAAFAPLVAQMVRDTLASPDILAGAPVEIDQDAVAALMPQPAPEAEADEPPAGEPEGF